MFDSGSKVECITCEKDVDKMQVRNITIAGKPQFECFDCYRKTKNASLIRTKDQNVKLELFCARCKYKFRSIDPLCPYCSQSNLVTRADVSARDFL